MSLHLNTSRSLEFGQYFKCLSNQKEMKKEENFSCLLFIQISSESFRFFPLKSSEIQIFFYLEFSGDFYIKRLFWLTDSDFFLYIQFCSHINSNFVSDQSVRSGEVSVWYYCLDRDRPHPLHDCYNHYNR